MPDGPLTGFRIIDAADHWGEMAGRTLADLGAEVIKVEPPGGSHTRTRRPHALDRSFYWEAVSRGKQSLVLDLQTSAGAGRLRELLAGADAFIHPAELAGFDLSASALTAINPSLVATCVTPWGRTGPDADRPATEFVIEAAGGLIGLQGDGDRPPVSLCVPQAALHSGVQAATDTIIALCARAGSGRGQQLDTSAQAAVVWTLMNASGYPILTGRNPPTTSEFRTTPSPEVVPGIAFPTVLPCADGYTLLRFQMTGIGERTFDTCLRWLERETEVPRHLHGLDLTQWMTRGATGEIARETLQEAADLIYAFVRKRTKRELQDFASSVRILCAPIYEYRDLLDDPQLAFREFWQPTGAGRSELAPGPFARPNRTPVRAAAAAPALNQHAEIHPARPPFMVGTGKARQRPFEGLKVADFSWVGVGPIIAKALADHGATVVHIESWSNPDIIRLLPPHLDDDRDVDKAWFMANFNTSKLGMTIDLGNPEGQQLGRRMTDWADVVLESFTPGTIARFGLGWDTLGAARDDLIMLSTCMRGQTGPEKRYAGFGNQGAALAGLSNLGGWGDRPPVGPWGAYTDFITPRYGIATLAAALLHRERTGEGQHIDISQIEAGIQFIEAELLEFQATGQSAERDGCNWRGVFPQGTWACHGFERYVAIAVETEAHWDALLSQIEDLQVFSDLRDEAQRRDVAEAINAIIAGFCETRSAAAVAERLRRAGVPTSVVQRPSDLYGDPQLAHRDFFKWLDHTRMGTIPSDGPVTLFSETPPTYTAAPCVGEHSEQVLRDLLGCSDSEITALLASGALGTAPG